MQSIIKHFQVLLPQLRAHVTGWQLRPKYIIILMWRDICSDYKAWPDQSKLLINCHLVPIKVCIPIVHCHCVLLLLLVVMVVDLIIRKTSSVF